MHKVGSSADFSWCNTNKQLLCNVITWMWVQSVCHLKGSLLFEFFKWLRCYNDVIKNGPDLLGFALARGRSVTEAQRVCEAAGLINPLNSCLMNTGTPFFSGNEFSLENCGSRIQVYLNEVTWGR